MSFVHSVGRLHLPGTPRTDGVNPSATRHEARLRGLNRPRRWPWCGGAERLSASGAAHDAPRREDAIALVHSVGMLRTADAMSACVPAYAGLTAERTGECCVDFWRCNAPNALTLCPFRCRFFASCAVPLTPNPSPSEGRGVSNRTPMRNRRVPPSPPEGEGGWDEGIAHQEAVE
jgi:hypothetical protein